MVNNKFSDQINQLNAAAKAAAKQYDAVFIDVSSNLVVATGILLAFSTQLVLQLQKASFGLKLMVITMIIMLVGSIAFGVLAQVLESRFYKKGVSERMRVARNILVGKLREKEEVEKTMSKIEDQFGVHAQVWPLVVQMSFLSVYFVLVISLCIIYLLA